MEDASVTKVDAAPAKTPPAGAVYKSWKKKYRKMRIVFDKQMHDGEELHKKEAKAAAIVKRLAVENEYVLPPQFNDAMCQLTVSTVNYSICC